jgi:hypothetical protein
VIHKCVDCPFAHADPGSSDASKPTERINHRFMRASYSKGGWKADGFHVARERGLACRRSETESQPSSAMRPRMAFWTTCETRNPTHFANLSTWLRDRSIHGPRPRPPDEEILPVKTKLHSPYFLTLFACLGLALAPAGCGKDDVPADTDEDSESGSGDGDGDAGDGDGDGDGDTMGDGDGDMGDGDGDGDGGDGDGEPAMCEPGVTGMGMMGATCTDDDECASCNCYLVPFLGGQCGECTGDDDCAMTTMGGCTPPNPFMNNGSTCNMGEAGGGCESDEVCADGLTCGLVLDLLGLVQISTCGVCEADADCMGMGEICAPVVIVEEFNGQLSCIQPKTLPNNSFCTLPPGNGDMACENVCSVVDIMGIAQVGACGDCNSDADCPMNQTCTLGSFDIGAGMLLGSTCG